MSHKIATIFLMLTFLVAAVSPTVVLAQAQDVHSCHETPVAMPTTCAVHCLSNVINENEIDFSLTSGVELFIPAITEDLVVPQVSVSPLKTFEKAGVFRDARIILSTIKRE